MHVCVCVCLAVRRNSSCPHFSRAASRTRALFSLTRNYILFLSRSPQPRASQSHRDRVRVFSARCHLSPGFARRVVVRRLFRHPIKFDNNNNNSSACKNHSIINRRIVTRDFGEEKRRLLYNSLRLITTNRLINVITTTTIKISIIIIVKPELRLPLRPTPPIYIESLNLASGLHYNNVNAHTHLASVQPYTLKHAIYIHTGDRRCSPPAIELIRETRNDKSRAKTILSRTHTPTLPASSSFDSTSHMHIYPHSYVPRSVLRVYV